nr:hypothetical protein GCM10020092_071970 [Actinoplanes digitatis]
MLAFAREHGLPIAIKAAFGGGGRGLKVARSLEEIPELHESAVREALAAFGRGECFVERYLDRPRHVETQCLADRHGNVVVVSTRDCSLQRRHQKLVEEAPAPFLLPEQNAELYRASKAILREAGYVGAGTVEFLVGADGTISFLEVNTRLQVEHPVSEEVTGIDLVREMFRIADGEELGYDDPRPRGHSLEFRINGEDPGRGFLPAPGTVTTFAPPSGPGVRLDSGVEAGTVVGPSLGLPARQAGDHRRRPGAGAAPGRPGARGVPGRRHGHRPAVPPGGGRRSRVRAGADRLCRAVHRAHAMDRDRVRQPDHAVRHPGDGRPAGARGATGTPRGGGRRPPDRSLAAGRHEHRRGPPRRGRRGRPAAPAAGTRRGSAPARRSPRRCRAPSSRWPSRRARSSTRAT